MVNVHSVDDLIPAGEVFGPLTAANDRAANEALLILSFQRGLVLPTLAILRSTDARICLMTDAYIYGAFVRYRSGLVSITRGDRCGCGCDQWRFLPQEQERIDEFDFFSFAHDLFESWLKRQEERGESRLDGITRVQVMRFDGEGKGI